MKSKVFIKFNVMNGIHTALVKQAECFKKDTKNRKDHIKAIVNESHSNYTI